MSEWISVEDKLPTIEDGRGFIEVMTRDIDGEISRAFYTKKYGECAFESYKCIDDMSGVTHWMPLPENPINEEEQ